MKIEKLIVLLLIFAWSGIGVLNAFTIPNFYPFGTSEGDHVAHRNDDGGSEEVSISISFPFFGQNHNSLFVNTNGVISFLKREGNHTPSRFPLGDGRQLVAPFWADVNTNIAGQVFHRETTNPSLLQQASADVKKIFVNCKTFRATWLFIATWYKVAFFGAQGNYTSKRNTFQAALITDGRLSFAIFNYNNLTWTTGTASAGNSSGLGGTPAKAGYNAGDGVRYFNIPGSGTHHVLNLATQSNVAHPGRWMYRIDNKTGDCGTNELRNLYRFGISEGDYVAPQNDDGGSGEVSISISFPFFGQNHNALFVNTNGIISFLTRVSQYTPERFPLGNGRQLVAPFWADVNTNVAGQVFHRETTDPSLLQQATADVKKIFVNCKTFRASWLFIATWYKVAFHNAQGTYRSKRNTFQAVLITDGRLSFAIFNYNNLTWTTGTSSEGNSSGLGGTPAQAGYNAGDGVRYFNIPGSGTHHVLKLASQSNVAHPGRWMYRIDTKAGDCGINALRNLYPFGISEGDYVAPQNDDGGSGKVSISKSFPFFGQNHNSLFVNTNGIISFWTSISQYTPQRFPLGNRRQLVAPFWADVNTGIAGQLFHRETTDPRLLQQATADVKKNFVNCKTFRASWLFIATWYKVAFHGAGGNYRSKRNTFQAVLITDGRLSFSIFNYNSLTWTTGRASDGNSSGLGGTPAQAGYNAGDGVRYFNIPGSGTHHVLNLATQSNVAHPGRWMYRIDTKAGDCPLRSPV